MKKKGFSIFLVLMVLAILTTPALADKPTGFDQNGNETAWQNSTCTDIQSGTLTGSDGLVITTGFDQWGYNYQAHMFNGGYCDAYRDAAWCQPYKDIELIMKWNDAWLANVDCSSDDLLDQHYGFPSYKGSGAWLTNHMKGTYLGSEGETCTWDSFTKIVAVPADAALVGANWFTAGGTEIGSSIWGEFAIIQDVYNDPCGGQEGIVYNGNAPTGFGFYAP